MLEAWASLIKASRSRLNPGEGAGDRLDFFFLIIGESSIVWIFDRIRLRDDDVVISGVDVVVIVEVSFNSVLEEVSFVNFQRSLKRSLKSVRRMCYKRINASIL